MIYAPYSNEITYVIRKYLRRGMYDGIGDVIIDSIVETNCSYVLRIANSHRTTLAVNL